MYVVFCISSGKGHLEKSSFFFEKFALFVDGGASFIAWELTALETRCLRFGRKMIQYREDQAKA